MGTRIQAASTTTQLDNVLRPPTLEANPTHSDWHYFQHTLKNYIKSLNMADYMQLLLLQNCTSHNGNEILDGLPTLANTLQQSFINATTQLETYFCSGSLVLLRWKLFFEAQQACNKNFPANYGKGL